MVLRSNLYLHRYAEPFIFDWTRFAPYEALLCLPAIAVTLFSGLVAHHPGAGTIAGGGAISVGFGSFQSIRNSRIAPMLLASLGMFAAAFVGTIAGHSVFVLACFSALWGFVYGLLAALGSGVSWVGLQSVIAMLVASGYPESLGTAAIRATLILGGGLLQTLLLALLIMRLKSRERSWPRDLAPNAFLPAVQILKTNLTFNSEAFQYGLRLAVTLAFIAGLARYFSLMNNYWAPITAVLLLKPDLHETFVRGGARIAGTLAGAGVATLVAATLHPGLIEVGILVVLFAWLSYSLLHVNYALYVACVTAYIVFLLGFGGLPEMTIVKYRAVHTVLGGLVALLAYRIFPVRQARRSES